MGGGLPAMLARLLAGGGGGLPSLPGGLQPQHLLMAAVGIFFMLPRLGIGVMPALLLGGAGVAVYSSAANGRGASGIMDAGRRLLGTVSSVLGRVTGRQISPMQAMFLLTAAAFLVYKFVLSSSSGGSFFSSPSPPNSQAGFGAYSKGYRDGKQKNPYDPISDEVTSSSSGGGGGWGIGRMLTMAMAGQMVYQLGGQPWSVPNLMANARNMSPMQGMILLNLISGLFG